MGRHSLSWYVYSLSSSLLYVLHTLSLFFFCFFSSLFLKTSLFLSSLINKLLFLQAPATYLPNLLLGLDSHCPTYETSYQQNKVNFHTLLLFCMISLLFPSLLFSSFLFFSFLFFSFLFFSFISLLMLFCRR